MYTIRVYHTYVSGYIFRGKVKRKLSESIPHFYNLFVSLSYKCLFQGGHSLFSLNFSQFFSSSMFSFTKSILLCIRSIYKQSIESNSSTRYLSSFYVHLSFVNVVFVWFQKSWCLALLQRDVVQFCVKSAFDCFTNVNEKSKFNLKTERNARGDVISKCEREFKKSEVKMKAFKGVLSQNVNENFKSQLFQRSKEERSKGCYLPPFQFPCESRCYDAAPGWGGALLLTEWTKLTQPPLPNRICRKRPWFDFSAPFTCFHIFWVR